MASHFFAVVSETPAVSLSVFIIDQIPDQSSAGTDETLEALHIFDPFVIDGVGDQVVVDIRLVIGLRLLGGRVLHIN